MTNIFGAQSQRFEGVVAAVARSQAAVWKVIDPDSDILRAIKKASPGTTTIVRVYTGAPTVDDAGQHPDPEAYGRAYAERVYAAVKDPAHMDYLEGENEPNDHYGNLTEFIKRQSAFLVGFSRRAQELGFRPLGPNFSTGYPECFVQGTDYQLWPNAWQGLADGLRALRDAGGALGLHEYGAPTLFESYSAGKPYSAWSDARQRGYDVGRHKAVYACLPADLQNLPLFITEFGIDFMLNGVGGGFWHDRNEDAPAWMIGQMREAWERVYSTTSQLKGICQFLWGTTNGPLFEEYDIARSDASIQEFTQFFAEQLPAAQGASSMITPQEISDKIAYTFAVANKWDLGQHLYGEVEQHGADGKDYIINLFQQGGVVVEKGHYGSADAKFFDRKTFTISDQPPAYSPPPPPVVVPPNTGVPYKFPLSLTQIGAVGEEGARLAGSPFYRITGATVRRGISAFMVVTVIDKDHNPAVGVKVVNLFPDGNGEVIETDGSGVARFQFAASSAFSNPGTGPFTVFIGDDSTYKDSDSSPKRLVYQARLSDIAHSLGDFQGTHTEISIQFIEQP